MKFKAIFFDMDGVLIDSMSAHARSWQVALKEFNLNISEEKLIHMGGLSFKETILEVARLNKKKINLKTIKNIYERKKGLLTLESNAIVPYDIRKNLLLLKKKEYSFQLLQVPQKKMLNIKLIYFFQIFLKI